MARFLGVAVLLLVLAVAAGCGGSDSSSDESSGASAAEEWAGSLCTAISDWRADLEAIGGDIADDPTSLSRDTLEDAANDARDATEQLVDNLRDLGAPDTEAGQATKEALEQLGDDLQQELDEAREAVENASGITGILNAISKVTGSFTTAGDAIDSTFDEIRELDADGELEQALRDSDACQDLTGDSDSG